MVPIVPALPQISFDAGADHRARLLLEAHSLVASAGPIVAIFPSGTHEHKRWPINRFSEVANALIASGAKLIFVGAEPDRLIAEDVMALMPRAYCTNLCGKTDLDELAAILRHCQFFVGNDGGVAHLAAAVGVPTCTIMSGVHLPGVWDPSVVDGVAVRAKGLPCLGCGSEFACPHRHRRCILDISSAEVIRECMRLLSRTSREPSV
jgi:ADP-heptose:LPS heptosyltransferase